MATTSTGFLRTPGELTISSDVRLDGTQHEGVAILVTRITLAALDSDKDKALLLCEQLRGVGLPTNESAIRVLSCPDDDTVQTEHHAIVIVKPMGPEEEQLTYLCADPLLGTEILPTGVRNDHSRVTRPVATSGGHPTAFRRCPDGHHRSVYGRHPTKQSCTAQRMCPFYKRVCVKWCWRRRRLRWTNSARSSISSEQSWTLVPSRPTKAP